MRLTTKGRYAVTAILDLALHQGHGPITLADIAERQGISLSYLEQLFAQLRRCGLVASTRGPGGGYNLGRPAAQINIAEVISAVDEPLDVRRCEGKANCQDHTKCLTHDLWTDLTRQIHTFLSGITLESLMQRRDVLEIAEQQDLRVRFGKTREHHVVPIHSEA
ncbi:MAG: Fe-S cluster assembly transcription factor [Gammaproteobacteria bacterium]|nr:Fe-S cluster assembly transcription factor [Gammaproteobacteria bacterium]